MKAKEIYKFRRDLENSGLNNTDTSMSVIGELVSLRESIDFIVHTWINLNLHKIQKFSDE